MTGSTRIVVVDDEPDLRLLLEDYLGAQGLAVRTAGSGAELDALLRAEPADLLILDVNMPNEDGFELIKRIRARPADRGGKVPAAALTAYARADDRRRVLAAGFLTHVVKPVDPAELIAVIASLVRLG